MEGKQADAKMGYVVETVSISMFVCLGCFWQIPCSMFHNPKCLYAAGGPFDGMLLSAPRRSGRPKSETTTCQATLSL